MTFSKLITGTSGNADQFSSRPGKIDRIIIHHCASTSLETVLKMMSTGSREVSANYVIGNDGEIIGVVPEESRAWTSGSAAWDGRAITFEVVNETGAPDWRISDKAMDALARMLADISDRYDIELSRTTVITHQELHTIHGASYPTACPGPYLQSRVDEVIAAAGGATQKAGFDMPALIKHPNTSVGFVSDSGELDAIGSMDEVNSLLATVVGKPIIVLPNPQIWNMLAARTARLRAQQGQVDPKKLAAEIAALMVGPVVEAVADAGGLTRADVEAAVETVTKRMLEKAVA